MKPKLVPNAGRVLKHAWSVRLMTLCLVTIVLEPVINTAAGLVVGQSIYVQLSTSALAGVFAIASIGARFVVQEKLREDVDGQPPEER
jgi:hypothetical protein